MRKVSPLLLSVLAISLFVSLGFVQSTYALPQKSGWESFWWTVYGGDGSATSSLDWLVEPLPNPPFTGAGPISWWPHGPYYNDRRLQGTPPYPGCPFPPCEYYLDGVFVCYIDWVMGGGELYPDSTFRYRVWIFWDPEDVPAQPGDTSIGGCFMFSHGTGDFKFVHAFGEAWVEWIGGPSDFYQYHEGWIRGAP